MNPSEWPRGTSIRLKKSSEIWPGAKGILGSTLQTIVFGVSHGKEKGEQRGAHFSVWDLMIQPLTLTEAFHNPCTGSQVRWLSANEYVKPPVCVFLILEDTMLDLVIERSIQKR